MDERDERTTDSGIELRPVYGADDLVGFDPEATWAGRARRRSPAACTPRCTAGGCGPCASTPAWARPTKPTRGSGTCSSAARPASAWRSTCRPRWARLGSSARRGRGRQVGRGDRLDRRHAAAVRRDPARPGHDVDDDQRDGGDPAAAVRAGRREQGVARRSAARSRTTSSRSTSPAGRTSIRRSRRCG